MAHRLDGPAVGRLVLVRNPLLNQLFSGARMLTFRHPRKIVCADLAPEPEVRRKSPLPLTADVLFLRIVGLCAAGEFLRVIPLRLARTQRTRDSEHQSKYG